MVDRGLRPGAAGSGRAHPPPPAGARSARVGRDESCASVEIEEGWRRARSPRPGRLAVAGRRTATPSDTRRAAASARRRDTSGMSPAPTRAPEPRCREVRWGRRGSCGHRPARCAISSRGRAEARRRSRSARRRTGKPGPAGRLRPARKATIASTPRGSPPRQHHPPHARNPKFYITVAASLCGPARAPRCRSAQAIRRRSATWSWRIGVLLAVDRRGRGRPRRGRRVETAGGAYPPQFTAKIRPRACAA